MAMTDPIAHMLTRIRNGNMAKFDHVDIPSSKIKVGIAKILLEEGYIRDFQVVKDGKQGILRVFLKYQASKKGVIRVIKRISKPSRRIYVKKDKIHPLLGGLGISILSTSKGVMTDGQAKTYGVGGELLCSVW